MAGDTSAKWPSPITFDDDDPKPGFAYITLKMPELKVKKSLGLVGKTEAKNADIIVKLERESASVEVKITDGPHYAYKKNLPVDIDEKNSDYKLKEGRVILVLCKAKKVSWAAHADYFLKRD